MTRRANPPLGLDPADWARVLAAFPADVRALVVTTCRDIITANDAPRPRRRVCAPPPGEDDAAPVDEATRAKVARILGRVRGAA